VLATSVPHHDSMALPSTHDALVPLGDCDAMPAEAEHDATGSEKDRDATAHWSDCDAPTPQGAHDANSVGPRHLRVDGQLRLAQPTSIAQHVSTS
jgi:hypothetical protein